MADIGTITGSELDENFDSDGKVRMLQIEFSEENVQSVELASICGIDYNPPDDAIGFCMDIYNAGKICIASSDEIEPSVDKGEIEVYSSDEGTKKSRIYLLKDGSIQIISDFIEVISDLIEINGNADYAVRFNELKTQFDELVQKFNALVDLYNAHTHFYNPGPSPPALTVSPVFKATSSTADISGAKVEEVKFP